MTLIDYTNKDFSKVYDEYYADERVLKAITDNLLNRETTFMGFSRDTTKEYVWRCIKAHNPTYLKNNFTGFNFFSRFYNIYHSVAILKNMPVFTFNMQMRMEQQNQFNQNFMSYVTGFDYVVDFDADKITKDNLYSKEPKDAFWREVQIVKHCFDKGGVPYTMKASSNEGFHLVVDDKYFVGGLQEKLQFGMILTKELKHLFGLETPDLTIYNFRRVWKVPYSLDIRTGAVALPINEEEFNKVRNDNSLLIPENVLKMDLVNRGMLERPFNYKLFVKFMEDMEVTDLIKNINTLSGTSGTENLVNVTQVADAI